MTDPRQPFYDVTEEKWDRERAMVAALSDEELVELYDLFSVNHLREVPVRYFAVTYHIRALISIEQKRRRREENNG